jgi:hypothetical protein
VAGVNQHNIPQFLSRGFRIPDGAANKDAKTWLYEKGIAPRRGSIRYDVAVEPLFYSAISSDGAKTLDDEITDYEDAAARRLGALRSATVDTKVNSGAAAEIVAHLTIRNAHLRRTFTMGVNAIIGRAVDVFCNETTLRPVLGVDRDVPSEPVRNLIDEQLRTNPILAATGIPAHVLSQMAQMVLKENFRTFVTEHVPHLMTTFEVLSAQAPAHIREGHNKALSSGLAPDRRIDVLKALRWRVLPCPDEGFVLPDCVALAADDEGGLKSLIVADLEKVTTVLMPLSTDRMLVGLGPSVPVPELSSFNAAAASASHTFFIAARSDDNLSVLSERIGQSSSQFVDKTVGAVFDEFLTTRGVALGSPAAAADLNSGDAGLSGSVENQKVTTPTLPKYYVHFHSCADHRTAEKIAAMVNVVTEGIAQMMPLDRLDGITFSGDYAVSLRNLERGFPASSPLQPTNEDYGVGVAMAPLVMRDGVLKTHIVMQGGIGHSLISEDEQSWRLALHLIVGQLAYAASAQILDESLPGILLKKFDDRYDGFLYDAIHSAWTGYFSFRASASFYAEAGLAQQELLLAVLKGAQADIPAARLDYRFHGDMGVLLNIVMPRIADILRFSGSLLGHLDGLGQPVLDDQVLATALHGAGLRDWFVLFDSELSQLWDRRRKWASFDEFLTLNRHVERVLWSFGLFSWRADDGQIQIRVPLAPDMAKLVGWRPRMRLFATSTWGSIRHLLARIAKPFRHQMQSR